MMMPTLPYSDAREDTPPRTADRAMWKTNLFIGYAILSIACSIYANHLDRTFLADDAMDGFTNQVTYVWNYLGGGNSIFSMEPLIWIHALRAAIATVFVFIEETFGTGASSFSMLLLFLPVVRMFIELRRGYFAWAIPLTVIIFSSRTVLVIISVAYLIMFISRNRPLYFLSLSFIFANLSSGAVMNNLIIATILVRNHRPKSLALHVYIAALLISFAISALDKYEGFVEQRSGYDSAVYGASGIEAILSRSTIMISLMEGNYLRFGAYTGMACAALFLFFVAWRIPNYRGYIAILLSAVPSVIFEGLGLVSLLIPVLLLVAGARLPWRPDRVVREGAM